MYTSRSVRLAHMALAATVLTASMARCGHSYAQSSLRGSVDESATADETLFESAKSAFTRSEYQAAANSFAHVADHPENQVLATESRFYLAESLMQLRRPGEARIHYNTFLATIEQRSPVANGIHPSSENVAFARFRLGEVAYFLREFETAERYLVAFVRDYPDHPLAKNAHTILPEVLLHVALGHFEAWQSSERKSDARTSLDDAEERLNRYLEAYQDGERYAVARYWLGRVLLEQGDPVAASEALRAAIETDATRPTEKRSLGPNAYFYSGEALLRLENYPSAAESFRRLISQWPNDRLVPEAESRLGVCQLQQGQADEARDCWRQVVRSTHRDNTEAAATAQWQIANSYQQQRQYAQASREFVRLATMVDPNARPLEKIENGNRDPASVQWQSRAYAAAGKCYEMLGDRRSAERMNQRSTQAAMLNRLSNETQRFASQIPSLQ